MPKDVIRTPVEDEFIEPMLDETSTLTLPDQEEFWRPPVRFGTIPIEKEPLGWDRRKGFLRMFPRVSLPFQIVERVSFGCPELPLNRLVWGDNLHVMRQLPSESIDLIYIDPPFFSGRQYNVIFGDQNEMRSFNDIWEGGMPGYLIWLNARLYEMKRLLKKTGSIYVHCDWHASHYIKVEMDKIFGHENFLNEIIWAYTSGGVAKQWFARKHDVLLLYARNIGNHTLLIPKEKSYTRTLPEPHTNSGQSLGVKRDSICELCEKGHPGQKYRLVSMRDVWNDIRGLFRNDVELIGYPTQKPESLLERVIKASTQEDGIVADFFCGGGTTPAVAQRLGRGWIACDQSRVAVAVTTDRLVRGAQQLTIDNPVPDFTIEHWGVYEARQLSKMPQEVFREFILKCFGARVEDSSLNIHGMKGPVPVWVGVSDPKRRVGNQEVLDFANAIRQTVFYQQSDLRDGVMLAWAFSPEARQTADQLREQEQVDVNFVRLDLIRIDSLAFREHIASLKAGHADYENFLTFVQPPQIEVNYKRVTSLTYKFDVGDTVVVNPNARIINVQWDFHYDGHRFRSTIGYSLHDSPEPVTYKFSRSGKHSVACKVQDDRGGEGLWIGEIDIES
ncbi:MAG: site-specific DNA-methyltransferase [Fimbriimonadia bacterium]|nr:site-specific DNA-methyltransferase [Fimbriimonadia bacterium]